MGRLFQGKTCPFPRKIHNVGVILFVVCNEEESFNYVSSRIFVKNRMYSNSTSAYQESFHRSLYCESQFAIQLTTKKKITHELTF